MVPLKANLNLFRKSRHPAADYEAHVVPERCVDTAVQHLHLRVVVIANRDGVRFHEPALDATHELILVSLFVELVPKVPIFPSFHSTKAFLEVSSNPAADLMSIVMFLQNVD